MKALWWQLYGLSALLVALIGVIEVDIPSITIGWRSIWSNVDDASPPHVLGAGPSVSGRDCPSRADRERLDAVGIETPALTGHPQP
jgi:hypothetical protein